VTRHAKASSAGSTSSRDSSLGSIRRAFATRVASSSADGSGPPSGRRRPVAALSSLALLLILALAATPASAITTRPPLSFSPIDGSGTGVTLHNPSGIAIDETSGNVFLNDGGSGNVTDIFGAEGGTPAGVASPYQVTGSVFNNEPSGVAIDNSATSPSKGALYVTDVIGHKVKKFVRNGGTELYEAAGELNPSSGPGFGEVLGVAVDSHGNVFVADYSSTSVVEFSPTGAQLARIGTSGTVGSPSSVALDNAGDLFVQGYNDRLYKYPANGSGQVEEAVSTQILSSGVTGIAVDSATNTLLVCLRNRVTEYNATTLAPGAEFGGGLGESTRIAANASSGRIYVAERGAGKMGVAVYGPVQTFTDASATLSAATNLTDVSADLDAAITDHSPLPTAWRLELSADGGSTWNIVASGETGGGETNAVASATASGLSPNSEYEFRLMINQGATAATESVSPPLSFKTVAPPPVLSDVGAVQVSDTSARMVGTIDPRNADTSYVFQYGTTPALGSSTAPLDIGGGMTPITISQLVSGLAPSTTYYFSLVATNPSGPTASPNGTFTTRATPLPNPENRGWEMVSPAEKNYGDADKVATYHPDVSGVSPDGNSVGFCTTALFGDPPGRMTQYCAPYMSRRTSSGWQTAHPFPEYCHIDPRSGVSGGRLNVSVSPDFSHFVIKVSESSGCPGQPLDPAAPLDDNNPNGVASNLYVEDPSSNPFSYHLLDTAVPPSEAYAGNRFVGGSDDFSHVVYLSGANQTAQPDSPAPGNFQKVYQWEKQGENGCAQSGGCLSLLSKDTSNAPFTASSGIPTFCCVGGTPYVNASAVSSDGRRVFFVNPISGAGNNIEIEGLCQEPGCEIYMREDASTTTDISESECTLGPAECGSAQSKADVFLYATPSGEDAFFISCAKLTNESAPESAPGVCGPEAAPNGAPAKLYRWDRNAAAGHHLVDLTVDHEPGDGVQPGMSGLIGTSDDGETAYFVANGQLVAGKPTDPGPKIYRWQWNGGSPTVDYLGAYEGAPSTSGEDVNTTGVRREVTPNGKYLMIYTKLRLDPVADGDSDVDVYRWDEANGWLCVSCQNPDVPSAGGVDLEEVYLKYYETLDPSMSNLKPRIFMSDDGQRIFFGTPDALVPQDVNGDAGCPLDSVDQAKVAHLYTCEDVYEWHDGATSLISSGTGDELSRLIAASSSGNDVFFYTGQRLVGWDKDDNIDIYDSRVGGGFPEPPAQPPSCEGEACRGAGTSAPSAAGAGTAVFQGPANPPAKHQKARKHRNRHQKHQKRHGKRSHSRAANHNRRAGR
jgi:hypothetical protein